MVGDVVGVFYLVLVVVAVIVGRIDGELVGWLSIGLPFLIDLREVASRGVVVRRPCVVLENLLREVLVNLFCDVLVKLSVFALEVVDAAEAEEVVVGGTLEEVGVGVVAVKFDLSLVNNCVVSSLKCTCGETVLATVFNAAPTTLVTVASVFSFSVPVRWRRLLTLLVLVALDSMDLVWLLVNASISRLCI